MTGLWACSGASQGLPVPEVAQEEGEEMGEERGAHPHLPQSPTTLDEVLGQLQERPFEIAQAELELE